MTRRPRHPDRDILRYLDRFVELPPSKVELLRESLELEAQEDYKRELEEDLKHRTAPKIIP